MKNINSIFEHLVWFRAQVLLALWAWCALLRPCAPAEEELPKAEALQMRPSPHVSRASYDLSKAYNSMAGARRAWKGWGWEMGIRMVNSML